MSVQDEIDAVEADLEEVRRQLAQAPADAYTTRIDLRERERDLQAQLAKLERERPVDAAALRAELEALERRRDRLAKERIDVVSQAGGGSAGGDFAFATDAWKLNRQIDEATGLNEIEDRIAEIKARLAGRGEPREDS